MTSRRIFRIVLSIALIASTVHAQTQAQCNATTGYGWASNSLGQDPCTIASSVGAVCQPGHSLVIQPIPNALSEYRGPTPDNQSPCICNSVYYSLLMVCALCQGGSPNPWSHYKTNCSTVYAGVLPITIPSDTLIPAWAYDDVVKQDGVDISLARTQTTLPESSGPASPTNASPTNTSPTSAESTTSTPSHKSKAGAIAGGVVGGLVLLALVAGGTFFYLKRRRRSGGVRVLDMSRDQPTPATLFSSPVYGMTEVPKLYDPSDPTTFPTSPVYSTSTEPQHAINSSFVHQGHAGPQFSGAAEI